MPKSYSRTPREGYGSIASIYSAESPNYMQREMYEKAMEKQSQGKYETKSEGQTGRTSAWNLPLSLADFVADRLAA